VLALLFHGPSPYGAGEAAGSSILLFGAGASRCASSAAAYYRPGGSGRAVDCGSSYLINRKRDLADIVTLTAGHGAGGKVRCGPLNGGLNFHSDKIGLRGGPFGNTIGTKELFVSSSWRL
jgi:hypothetical protein